MKCLGLARVDNGRIVLPDGTTPLPEGRTFEVVDLDGDLLLTTTPLDRARLDQVDRLAQASISDHRTSLEGLAI